MTPEGEEVRVPQHPQSPQQSPLPRLFSDAETIAWAWDGGGDDGVGAAASSANCAVASVAC